VVDGLAARPRRAAAQGSRLAVSGLARQALIWLAFVVGFAVVSSLAGHRPDAALANGSRVVDAERALFGGLPELTAQRVAGSTAVLKFPTVLTYRTSEFVVLTAALLWVYLRRRDAFFRLRNTLFAAALLALVFYFVIPTAPPRMFPELGFVDSVSSTGGPSRDPGILALASNPYAAMPSLHAADALIIGVGLALLVRSRTAKVLCLLWPVWVWFCVLATGNHFVLDVCAGIVVALVAATAVNGRAFALQLGARQGEASA
jgi:hypothetical protein